MEISIFRPGDYLILTSLRRGGSGDVEEKWAAQVREVRTDEGLVTYTGAYGFDVPASGQGAFYPEKVGTERYALVMDVVPTEKDTEAGAIRFLGRATTLDVSGATAVPDPVVDGVWKVTLANGREAIVYLAGYPNPFGDIRDLSDVEVEDDEDETFDYGDEEEDEVEEETVELPADLVEKVREPIVRTWNSIGYDVIAAYEDEGRDPTFYEVMEATLDADRIAMYGGSGKAEAILALRGAYSEFGFAPVCRALSKAIRLGC